MLSGRRDGQGLKKSSGHTYNLYADQTAVGGDAVCASIILHLSVPHAREGRD